VVQRVHCLALITEGLWPAEIENRCQAEDAASDYKKGAGPGISRMKTCGLWCGHLSELKGSVAFDDSS
jgi:hypothetical protein